MSNVDVQERVTVVIHHETELAWLVSDDGVRLHAVWLPKRFVTDPSIQWRGGQQVAEFDIPEWLAKRRGFI